VGAVEAVMRAGVLFNEATHVELLRRLRVIRVDDRREMVMRIAITIGVAWVPLLVLSLISGDSASVTAFLRDVAVHARFLIAVPLFIAADYVVLPRLESMARYFAVTNLVPASRMDEYNSLLANCRRLSAGIWPSGVLVVAVYALVVLLAILVPKDLLPLWQRGTLPTGLSLAGWWHLAISLPLQLGLLLAWLWRLSVWTRFLWRMAHMGLYLVAAHPDHAGGLQFLAYSPRVFSTLALPIGIVVAGTLANKVIAGASPLGHEATPVVTAAITLLLFATPPLVFTHALMAAWRIGVYRYGNLAARAGETFEYRWLAEGQKVGAELLDRPDFSATTDLYAIVANVYAMRTAIYDIPCLLSVVIATVLPFVPIWLSAIPFSAIVNHLVDALF
jgi:hypothetical protein